MVTLTKKQEAEAVNKLRELIRKSMNDVLDDKILKKIETSGLDLEAATKAVINEMDLDKNARDVLLKSAIPLAVKHYKKEILVTLISAGAIGAGVSKSELIVGILSDVFSKIEF